LINNIPIILEYNQVFYNYILRTFNSYIDRKTIAREEYAKNGTISKDYLGPIKKPTGLKLFPGMGMISNTQTY
jgi:hypothetical protein